MFVEGSGGFRTNLDEIGVRPDSFHFSVNLEKNTVAKSGIC